jgi:hypothetical protein
MPFITVNFPNPINVSVQVGDVAYYVVQVDPTTLPSSTASGAPNPMGEVTEVGDSFIVVDVSSGLWNSGVLTQGVFVMFAKNNIANMSSLLGYFARFKFENSSNEPSELYTVGADYFESSK